MKLHIRRELHNGDKIAIAAIAIASLVGLALFSSLPEQVASHWNLNGVADGFMEKTLFVVAFPLLMILTYLIVSLVPSISKLKQEMHDLHVELSGVKGALVAFLAYIYLVVLISNTEFAPLQVSTAQLLFPGISLLLYYFGKIMPRLKRNHFVGIRTPWTIESDEVWHKTHLLGGKLFKALSVAVMLATLTASTVSTMLVVIPILAVAIILIGYSYRISKQSRKIKREKK